MRSTVRLSPRIAVTAGVVVIAATAAAVSLADSASAAPAASQPRSASCGLGTLRGNYLFAANGYLVSSGGASIPFAFSGHETYDGAGSVHGVLTSSENGTIADGTVFTGTYTVTPDCVGALTVALGSTSAHYALYIAPSGDNFTYTQTDPGVVLSASEHRAN